MGYYSNVTVGMKTTLFKKMWEEILNIESPAIHQEVMRLLSVDVEIQNVKTWDREEAVILQFSERKWYAEFIDVGWFMKFLRSNDEENWCFLCIGENIGDVEIEGEICTFPVRIGAVITDVIG